MSMLGFLNDMDNYDDRVVGRDEFDWGYISTAQVSDGRQPIETAIGHEEYNNGKLVIVEAYDTVEEAKVGHARWIKANDRGATAQ